VRKCTKKTLNEIRVGGRECAYLTARAAMPATKAKVLLNSMLVIGVRCLCGCVACGGRVGSV